MAFAIILSITVILFITFAVTPKKLHLFEIFFIWMVIIVIHHNFITVFAVNLQWLDIARSQANYWTLVLMRVALEPLLIIWYLDRTLAPKRYKKWLWLPVAITALVGIEYLGDALNVFKHTRWELWWSFIEWLIILLLVIFPWLWYRNLLRKEMR